jgi:hypothetical protein
MIPITINRALGPGRYEVTEVFEGLDESSGLKRLLPDDRKRKEFLASTHIEVTNEDTYMWTDDADGHVNVGLDYLRDGEAVYLYMDILHELVHVRQFKDGKELFPTKIEYIDRQTEIEAYQFAVDEGRRLGLSDDKIYDYLEVEWISKKEHDSLARRLGVKIARST